MLLKWSPFLLEYRIPFLDIGTTLVVKAIVYHVVVCVETRMIMSITTIAECE